LLLWNQRFITITTRDITRIYAVSIVISLIQFTTSQTIFITYILVFNPVIYASFFHGILKAIFCMKNLVHATYLAHLNLLDLHVLTTAKESTIKLPTVHFSPIPFLFTLLSSNYPTQHFVCKDPLSMLFCSMRHQISYQHKANNIII